MGLRKLYTTQSLADAIWHYIVYLEARLLHDPVAKEFAPRVTALVDEIEATWQAQRSTWRAEIAAQAGVDAVNDQLDQQTNRFSRVLLSQEGIDLNTEHPRYKRYFTVSLSRVTRLALAPQLKLTRPWLDSIRTEPEAPVQAFSERLTALVAQGDEALKRQEQAIGARKDHRVREINALVARINDTCQEIYGTLKAKAPASKLPPEWAEGFFYSPRNASAPDAAALYRESLYNICKARELEVSEAVSELIEQTRDAAVLQRWVGKALLASTAEEVVGLPVPVE